MKLVHPQLNFVKVGCNQYFSVMLLLEEEIPSNFTICVNYMHCKIAEFTDNKTLTGRISIEIAARFRTVIPKIPGFHYKSIVYLSIKNSISYANSIYMSKYEMITEYSRTQIRHLNNSFQVCGLTIYLVIQSTAYLQFFYTEFWKLIERGVEMTPGDKSYILQMVSHHKTRVMVNGTSYPHQLSWVGV